MRDYNRLTISKHRGGVTLIELLVGVGIIGVLGLLAFSVGGHALKSTEETQRVHSIRQVGQAYLLYAQDHGGELIPGVASQRDTMMMEVKNHRGELVTDVGAKSLPTFRLLPYLNGEIRTYFPGSSEQFIYDVEYQGNEDYYVSNFTSFGLNRYFLGGEQNNIRWEYIKHEALTEITQAYDPSNLIVFAATNQGPANQSGVTDDDYEIGLSKVEAPNNWAGSYNPDIPKNWGYIRINDDQKALVVNLDNSVSYLDEGQLRDMRRWSNNAALQNNKNYVPSLRR